jgi:hypothetical protein
MLDKRAGTSPPVFQFNTMVRGGEPQMAGVNVVCATAMKVVGIIVRWGQRTTAENRRVSAIIGIREELADLARTLLYAPIEALTPYYQWVFFTTMKDPELREEFRHHVEEAVRDDALNRQFVDERVCVRSKTYADHVATCRQMQDLLGERYLDQKEFMAAVQSRKRPISEGGP